LKTQLSRDFLKVILYCIQKYRQAMKTQTIFLIALIMLVISCFQVSIAQNNRFMIANLYEGQTEAYNEILDAFRERNPGYDFHYLTSVSHIEPVDFHRIIFLQHGEGNARITNTAGEVIQSPLTFGDMVILRKGENIITDVPLGFLSFTVPDSPPAELPNFIRPDWDPNITDVPGGCATEIDAYRRILLTWRKDVGEYIYHSLNAHRVRIRDSFSHYHPEDIGFDEFYLVQMTEPGAKIIISEYVDLIKDPENLSENEAGGLIREYELREGDLVYIPRGVMHRGVGGVLAQVITMPGFIPGSEIGLDHLLRQINEKFDFDGNRTLPYNIEFSAEPVIR
jgi:hypothetical protein